MEKSGRLKALKNCGSDTVDSKKLAVNKQGPVAQLVSVPPCHGGGRGFKSRQGRQAESPSERKGFCLRKRLLEAVFWLCSSVGRAFD